MNSTGPEHKQEQDELVRARQLLSDAGTCLKEYKTLDKVVPNSEVGDATCSSAIASYLHAHELLVQLSHEDPQNVKLSIDVGASYLRIAEAFWVCRERQHSSTVKEERVKIIGRYVKEGTWYAEASREWTEQALGFFERFIREHASDPRHRRELFAACMDVYHHLVRSHFRRQALPLHWAHTVIGPDNDTLLMECRKELAKAFHDITSIVTWYWTWDKGRGGLASAEDPKREEEQQRLDYDYLRELLRIAIALMAPVVQEQPKEQKFVDELQRDLRDWSR